MISIDGQEVLGVFVYGSSVYGLPNPQDIDLIVVKNADGGYQTTIDIVGIKYDVSVYDKETFERELFNNHEISFLECLFLPRDKIIYVNQLWWKYIKDTFVLHKDILRRSISAKASNSYVKAKKKLTVEKDYDLYKGKKSLYHAMRIVKFGSQIAIYGKIVDYSVCNYLYYDIMSAYLDTWEKLEKEFKPVYNSICSEFRKVAPKF